MSKRNPKGVSASAPFLEETSYCVERMRKGRAGEGQRKGEGKGKERKGKETPVVRKRVHPTITAKATA